MEEEHKEEMPVAVEEPHVTTEETPTSQQEALTELENVKDSPTAEVEMASDEKSVQDSETGGEKVADVNTDAVEDGDNKESEDQEDESNEAKTEDAPAQVAENGEVKDGGNGEENDGTTERKDTEGGDQTSPGEEENEEDQVTKTGSQPDPQQQTAEEEEPKSPLPESSTFGEGERPETPVVAVTDPLSREGSPVQEPPQAIPPGTPERIRSPVIEEDRYEEEEVEEEDQLEPREKIVERYQAAIAEREQLLTTNMQFQHKLAEYFRKKKTDDQRQEMDKNVTDQEQRYLKYMSNLEELREQEEEGRRSVQNQLADLKIRKDEKLHLVDGESREFAEFKKQTALIAINSRTGKSILPKDVEQYLLNEVKKEDEVKQVRLENIKLKNRLKKREQQLKAKEELAEGLHLIDFEQLKIENQTYNEKIEERNEELLKLRKKITSTVQVLTHVKEKLQFVQAENQVQKAKLKDVEELVAKKRDILSRTKKARDCLRIDNQRQMQKCGLLGNKPLLLDFEERKDEGDDLRARLEYLKRRHAELTLDSNGLKKKIEEARSVRN